ncbi:MAG: LysR family transcriptional regulator [Caulobacterales bacterium]|uniref:LysR family transcriptional regulator n=1 Tax=Glycocaulis sp. TaxID=1969725 RepID=UPI003F9F6BD2
MLSLRTARLFVACADTGTLTAAAARLNVSQPAATKSLAQMEASLGGALFQRAGRRLVLTALGEAMLPRARTLVQQARDMEAEARRWKSGEEGAIRLGTGPAIAYSLLPDAAGLFYSQGRNVRLTVRSGAAGELIERLRKGELDLVVADSGDEEAGPDLTLQRLPDQHLAAAVRPGHPALAGEALENFAIATATPPGRLRQFPLGWNAGPPGIVCDDYAVLARAVSVSDHILIAPQPVMTRLLAGHQLAALPVPVSGLVVRPALIWRSDAPTSAAREALCACFDTLGKAL